MACRRSPGVKSVKRRGVLMAAGTCHGEDDNPWQVELLHDGLRHGRLARARTSSYSDDANVCPWRRIVCPLLYRDMALEL
jgi:hypothetical protein